MLRFSLYFVVVCYWTEMQALVLSTVDKYELDGHGPICILRAFQMDQAIDQTPEFLDVVICYVGPPIR